ncbi:hypothetical protein LXL04_002416 [Taraxacum kok-saghyz]
MKCRQQEYHNMPLYEDNSVNIHRERERERSWFKREQLLDLRTREQIWATYFFLIICDFSYTIYMYKIICDFILVTCVKSYVLIYDVFQHEK